MEGVGLSEEQWGAALRLLQDITEEDKRRATLAEDCFARDARRDLG